MFCMFILNSIYIHLQFYVICLLNFILVFASPILFNLPPQFYFGICLLNYTLFVSSILFRYLPTLLLQTRRVFSIGHRVSRTLSVRARSNFEVNVLMTVVTAGLPGQ